MGVLFQPRRPIARWAATAVVRDRFTRNRPPPTNALRNHEAEEAQSTTGALAYLPQRLGVTEPCPGLVARALDALATSDVSIVPELFTEDVVGWWPNFGIASRRELEMVMADQDHALADVRITSFGFCVGDDRVAAEWLLTGQHSEPMLLGDDVLVEPTNRQVVLAGVTLAHVGRDGIDFFHHYFDDTAILEQVLRHRV